MKENEKWYIVPSAPLSPHGLSIRDNDGSFRRPTDEEIASLLAAPRELEVADKCVYALKVGLNDALGIIRAYVAVYGSDEELDKEIRRLVEMIK